MKPETNVARLFNVEKIDSPIGDENLLTVTGENITFYSRENRFPDRGRELCTVSTASFLRVEKIDSPIGDENWFLQW